MDFSEATKIVFSRIQKVEPELVSKIIGYLLLKDYGDREMIRLAFGPDSAIHSLISEAKSALPGLGLSPKPTVSAAIHAIPDLPLQFSSYSPAGSRPLSSSAPFHVPAHYWESQIASEQQQSVHDFAPSLFQDAVGEDYSQSQFGSEAASSGSNRGNRRSGVGGGRAPKMPKKMGVNSKAEAARTRKSAVEAERKEKDARDKEERYWKEAEGPKSRAAKKREDEAEKRADLATRKAEIRRLAEMEQEEIEKAMRKPDKKASRVSIPVPKVTEADLERRREEERLRLQREAEAAKKRQSRTTAEEEYERMVLVSNTNRDDSLIEAHTVEEAIAQMSVAEPGLPPDRHPERRLKASYKAFEEAELPKLKEEKPGLTLTQYKDMIWKLWQRSPDNPMNAQAAE